MPISFIVKKGPAWYSVFDNTKWGIEWSQGSWVTDHWESELQTTTYYLALIESGTWNVGFRPTHVRVTLGGVIPSNLLLKLGYGNSVFALDSDYESLVEAPIPDHWASGDISRLQFEDSTATGIYTVTNIEFYSLEAPSS